MSDIETRFEANPEQAEYWNGPAGLKWVEHEKAMDVRLRPVAVELMRRADPRPGERVLDVGCGAGVTAELLGEAVGPKGRVLGVDLSDAMLRAARERCRRLPQVELRSADAQVHPFPDAGFDLVSSRFGVMFFADPYAAFSNLQRALRPGGRLWFACWAPVDRNPWFTVALGVARGFLGDPEPSPPRAPGPLAFSEADYVRDILATAGFEAIGVEAFETVLSGPEPPEEQAALFMKLGPTARLIAAREPDEATLLALKKALADELRNHVHNGAIGLGATVYLVSARR